ncbi:MAG: hypothetical protein Q3X95_06885 [Duodenibacillus sp.]|nr:hypothetical protein [Duodenibacillus sp.]
MTTQNSGTNAQAARPVKGAPRNPRLVLEIAVVLCCKLAVIFALWFFFFGPDKRIDQTPENIASGILDRAPSAVVESER